MAVANNSLCCTATWLTVTLELSALANMLPLRLISSLSPLSVLPLSTLSLRLHQPTANHSTLKNNCPAPHKEPHCSSPPYPTLTLLLWFWVTWLTGAQASGGVCLFKLFCLTEGQEYVCTLLLLSCPFHPAVPSPIVHTLVLKCDSDTNCLLMSSSPPIFPL